MISAALRRALFGVGPTAACRAALQRMRYRPAACDTEPDAFDRARGSETTGFSSWRALRTGRACDPYNAGYLPAEPAAAETLLSCVTQPEAFTFVDLGCGKGRVLTLAAEKGFRRVIGIEVHPALAAIARENVARSHPDIEIWNEDAVEVTLPSEKLVLFLFHPFWGPVMQQVACKLARSLSLAPHEVFVLYVNPALAEVFDSIPALERAYAGPAGVVWHRRRLASPP